MLLIMHTVLGGLTARGRRLVHTFNYIHLFLLPFSPIGFVSTFTLFNLYLLLSISSPFAQILQVQREPLSGWAISFWSFEFN